MNRCCLFIVVMALTAGCSDNETATSKAPDIPTVSENERYDNPVDKKTYVADGGWKTHQPEEPRTPDETGRIHNAGVRLLTAQDEIAERTSVESLAAFIQLAETSAQTTLSDVSTKATVIAQFSCTPGKHAVQLSHHGSVTQDQLQAYYDGLMAIEAISISSGEISFQLTIEIEPANLD